MTKNECEDKIMEKLREIRDIYHEFNPNGIYLTMYIQNGNLYINNAYWGADIDTPIDTKEIQKNEALD